MKIQALKFFLNLWLSFQAKCFYLFVFTSVLANFQLRVFFAFPVSRPRSTVPSPRALKTCLTPPLEFTRPQPTCDISITAEPFILDLYFYSAVGYATYLAFPIYFFLYLQERLFKLLKYLLFLKISPFL